MVHDGTPSSAPILPVEEQDLLADTWIDALDLLAEGDAEAGRTLLRRGLERARGMDAPWQPALARHWQVAFERYPSSRPPRINLLPPVG